MANRDTEPQVIILTYRKRFVESACQIEQFFGHHDRGWTDQTKFQTPPKNISGGLSVPRFGIYSQTITNPNFLSLADVNPRVSFHEISLNL
jgi:hypothetical protein